MVTQTEQTNTWCGILKLSNEYFLMVYQQIKVQSAPLNKKKN